MATYPIKVLLDRNRQPFIPFATTSSIVENGTNRRLDKMLGNLDDLQTNNKNSLVSAINEILTQHGSGGSSTGWQVVDVLPTENISTTTIYLVHKEGAKKPNIYEEWIWVNEDWENIGTTEIDLSGYATTTMVGDLNTLKTTDKDCIVDAINEIVDTTGSLSGSINSLSEYHDIEVIKLSGAGPGNSVLKADYQKFTDALNRMLKLGRLCPIYLDGSLSYYKGIYVGTSGFTAGASFVMFGMLPVRNSSSYGDMCGCSMTIDLAWDANNETCTVTNIRSSLGSIVDLKDAVTKSSTQTITGTKTFNTLPKSSITPTDDTHLVNKKYVDDAIAAAGSGSGSAFDPAKYLAIDNTTEYTPTDLYHPATKAYVDSQIASVPEPVDAYSKTEIDGKLSNYLSKTNTESYTPTSDYHPATKKFVESVVASMDMSGYYTKTEVNEFLSRQNTRFYFDNPNIALAVTNEFQDITIYNSSDTAVTRWATGKIVNGTDDKLCVYTAKIGRPHYLEVTITYQADDGLVFNNSNSLLCWHRLKDDGTEVGAGSFIGQYTPQDKGDYHVVKYLLYLWGDATTSDIYLKRTSNMKCKTKNSTTIYYLTVTVVPWLPVWD